MNHREVRRIGAGIATLATGACFFNLLPSCESILKTANPCGTVLAFCEPYEIDQLFTEIPNYTDDPSCTIPFYGFDPANPNPNNCATSPVYPTSNGERPE